MDKHNIRNVLSNEPTTLSANMGVTHSIDALLQYIKAALIEPNHVPTLINCSTTLIALNRPAEAAVYAERACALNPTEITLATYGQALYQMGDHPALQGLSIFALQQHHHLCAIQFMQQAGQLAPNVPLYHRNLGELLRRVGRLHEAIAAHRVAIQLEPQSAENHFHLGIALNDNHQFDMAILHYRTALALNPKHGLAWNNLGSSLEMLGDKLAAKAAYAEAIVVNSSNAEAHNNFGAICSEQGHLDEARDHFEKAIAINHDFVEAHYNLSSFKTYSSADPHLQMLESITQRIQSISVSARIRYYFALGKALDDTGSYARAFQAYAAGNRLQYEQQPWDETRLKTLTSQIPLVFTRSFLKKPRKTNDKRRPIFIVGMPRSGTSLIEQILSSHASVYGAGELSILDEVLQTARGASKHTPHTKWAAQLTDNEFIDLGKAYMDRVWELSKHHDYITDKMPGNCFYVGMIYRMLPHAKIIHAMRDPMDSCFSCFTRLFNESMPFSYDQHALGRYFTHYITTMQYWHTVLPKGVILDLSYETMVNNHEAQVRQLLDFLSLPWDPNCLDFYKNDRHVKTASNAQVRKPIYTTSIKRWEHFSNELETLHTLVEPYRVASL